MKDALRRKVDSKAKPLGSLGRLESIAIQIGLIQRTLSPVLAHPTHIVFAGDHGLAQEGVSPYPKQVTAQMVMNFLAGGAAINVFCRQHHIALKVVDAGVDYDFPAEANLVHAKMARGTRNILAEPAMSPALCREAMDTGRQIVDAEGESGCNILSLGEMGIGNSSSASLLMHKFTGLPIEACTGRGAGHGDEGMRRKLAILKSASTKHQVSGPEEVLAAYGGFEIAMMAGALLQAKARGMVLVIDGFITTSSLLAAYQIDSSILGNCIFSHCSGEAGHRTLLEYLGVEALLDLNMRLGEGTGAVVAFPLIESAVLFLTQMASFDDAGVAQVE